MNVALGRFAVMLIVMADLVWVTTKLPPLSGLYAAPLAGAAGVGARHIAVLLFPDKVDRRS